MMNEEKEIKILLTESEYNLLDRYFKWTMNITQTNHYFGSENDIRKKGDTYRIREKKGKYYLQVKVPQLYEGSLHVKKEYEKEVGSVPTILDKKELSSLLGIEVNEDKKYLGKLVTERKVCTEYQIVEICLDRNEYLDYVDYELEIEFTGVYPKEVVEKLHQYGIKTDEDICGKYSRYLQRFILAQSNII